MPLSSVFAPNKEFWSGKRVFITGHTGFKGTWLALWLRMLGATVKGYALPPPTEPSMFAVLGGEKLFESFEGDIRDRDSIKKELVSFAPDAVFHLAAQALVIDSYTQAFETFETNAMGTASVLEACRACDSVRAIVAVATDKVYENREWMYSYRESDPLGGKDPYSASKAAAEIVVSSYRESFFRPRGISLASGRAGNVFGGGDWAENRLVPDGFRSFSRAEPLIVRNPDAIRPWQFVLEPLLGYVMLGRACLESTEYDTAFNFGPNEEDVLSVAQLADAMVKAWGGQASWKIADSSAPRFKEANTLLLNSGYAKQRLAWSPLLTIAEALELTMDWYRTFDSGDKNALMKTTEQQLSGFFNQCETSLV